MQKIWSSFCRGKGQIHSEVLLSIPCPGISAQRSGAYESNLKALSTAQVSRSLLGCYRKVGLAEAQAGQMFCKAKHSSQQIHSSGKSRVQEICRDLSCV